VPHNPCSIARAGRGATDRDEHRAVAGVMGERGMTCDSATGTREEAYRHMPVRKQLGLGELSALAGIAALWISHKGAGPVV
jgi:hypothetical protein